MPKFDIHRKTDWNNLVHEYDLDGKRLLPWDGYPMPFGGGWCVVRPHTRSLPHTQIDQEIFIAIKGKATCVVGDERFDFEMGDIVAVPKHTDHYIVNDSDEDFHFYVIWWDQNYVEEFMKNNDENTGCLNG